MAERRIHIPVGEVSITSFTTKQLPLRLMARQQVLSLSMSVRIRQGFPNKGFIMSKFSEELWAVVDIDGKVAWTRGGSSSSKKLMVYDSEKKAVAMMENRWIKQEHSITKLYVVKIYG